MPRIISETENYHLKKRPWDEMIIKGMSGGFYSAINKIKQEKEGNKNGK